MTYQGGDELAREKQSEMLNDAGVREGQGGAEMAYDLNAMGGSVTQPTVGGWTLGFITFAGVLMIMGGFFQFFIGLFAVLDPDFYNLARAYTLDMSVETWGWVHMGVAVITMIAGFYVFTGNIVARLIGIVIALASAIFNFTYIPYYPVWSLLIIGLDVAVICALATYSHKDAESLTAV